MDSQAFVQNQRSLKKTFKCRLLAGGSNGVRRQAQEMRQEGEVEGKLGRGLNVRSGNEEASEAGRKMQASKTPGAS